METILLQAISTKNMIRFTYQGRIRICEPHVYGIANGRKQVLCYQDTGGSQRGGLPEWRRFDLQEIRDLEALDQTFPGKRTVPHPHSIGWDSLISVVA